MIQIQEFTSKTLKEAVFLDSLWDTKDVPITKHRALFLASNPRADENDLVLLIAYKNGEMVGYRALFPDILYVKEKSYKMAWGSNFWVSEILRGEGIGKALLKRSLEAYNGRIGSLSPSEKASKVYVATDSFNLKSDIPGITLIYRSNLHYWIPRKISGLSGLESFFSAFDYLINLWTNCRLNLWKKKMRKALPNDFSLEYLSEICDLKTIEFIDRNNSKYLTRKGAAELNHIVKIPTSLATPLKDHIKSRYFFSYPDKKFNYYLYKIIVDSQKLVGLCLLNESGNFLNIQYYYYLEGYQEYLYTSIALHMIELKCNMLTTFDQSFMDYLDKFNFPKLYTKKRQGRYFLPRDVNPDDLDDLIVQDGDGA